MEQLFSHFERELVSLRRLCREFSERYPKVAGNLQIGGESCDDPHVERLIQSVALLAARVSKRLDDDYPQFTEALLDVLFPHYLRPFPSCAIARIDRNDTATEATKIPRGSTLDSSFVEGVRCTFQTAYDLTLAPISLSAARFDAVLKAPSGITLPAGASSSISIVIEAAPSLQQLAVDSLRVYTDGEPSFCAALRDALFMRTVRACVQVEGEPGIALASIPLTPAGFAENDALIPFGARSHPAYRVLIEYFAFPEKFNFFDIDLAAIRAILPRECGRFTLHLVLGGLRTDSSMTRLLGSLSSHNLLLGCTPVVNLFRQPGVPIAVTQLAADYTVLAHPTNARAFEVYSIDSVQMVRQRENGVAITEFRPFYSLRHGEGGARKGHYWVLRHDQALAAMSPGHEKTITLVDSDCDLLALEKTSLSLELSCTNRDLPCLLKYGQAEGDLILRGTTGGNKIHFLRRPTQPYRFKNGFGAHWRLISHLTLNHHSLAQEGLQGLREMLTLYDLPQSPISQRQIGGIVGLEHAETVTWMRHKRGASLVHGIEVRITLDEEAFVGSGLHLFVQVIEQFFGLYVQLNSFIELVALSQRSGEELIRCKPRSGNMNLV
ncbi:MAG: type VI secretion system baseplate subunit TssF [Telluria sp.]